MKKTIISLISAMAGAAVGAGVMGKTKGKVLTETAKMSDKHLALFLMMNQWVKVKQEGKQLSHFFKNNGYKKVNKIKKQQKYNKKQKIMLKKQEKCD